MFVALEGIDGAGKTTLARGLAARLVRRGHQVDWINRRALPAGEPPAVAQLGHLSDAIWPPESEHAQDVWGTHFSLYLLAAWYSALNLRLPDKASAGATAIVDGWFYRVLAKAHLRSGLDRRWLYSLFAHIRAPDTVVLVDIDPGLAFQRKSSFSPSEMGHWDGHDSGQDENDFTAYQARVRSELLAMAQQLGWVVVRQEGDPVESVLDRLEEIVTAVLF